MKKHSTYKIYLIAVLTGFFMASCADKLELNPRQSLSESTALTDYTGIENALIGAWDALQHPDFLGANYVMNSELMSGNIYWIGSYTNFSELADKRILPHNAATQPYWMFGYQAIDRANKIIDVAREGKITDGLYLVHKDRILGNALFIRALAHFELVRVFGQPAGYSIDNSHVGIPIITKGTYIPADAEKVSRATVAQVYTQVIEDMEEAISLLPASAPNPFPSAITAKALLARIHLESRNWEKAAQLALEIIDSQTFRLNDHPSTFFSSPYSAESVMEIIHTQSDNPRNTRDDLANYWNPQERNEITIPLRVVEMYEESDLRRNWFYNITSDDAIDWYSGKYMHQADNIAYMRYAEILLIRAEALAMLNPGSVPQEAVDLLGKIRERAQASHVIPETAEELFDAIMLEREKELMHEGSLFYDLKRWRRDDIRFSRAISNDDLLPWDKNRMIYPIPQRELDVNPNLMQNPGY